MRYAHKHTKIMLTALCAFSSLAQAKKIKDGSDCPPNQKCAARTIKICNRGATCKAKSIEICRPGATCNAPTIKLCMNPDGKNCTGKDVTIAGCSGKSCNPSYKIASCLPGGKCTSRKSIRSCAGNSTCTAPIIDICYPGAKCTATKSIGTCYKDIQHGKVTCIVKGKSIKQYKLFKPNR